MRGLGGVAQFGDGAAGLVLKRPSLEGRRFGKGAERLQRRPTQKIAFGLGLLAHVAQLGDRFADQIAQDFRAPRRGGGHLLGLLVGLAQYVDELRLLAFEIAAQLFLVGAHGVGQGDQGRALLAQALLHRLALFADRDIGRLQARGLARQVVARRAGGVCDLAGGRGEPCSWRGR